MNKYRFIKILFLSGTLILVGCTSVTRDDFVQLQAEVAELKNRVSNQTIIMSDLNERTNALNTRTAVLERGVNASVPRPKKYPYPQVPSLPTSSDYHPIGNYGSAGKSSAEKNLYNHAYSLYTSGSYNQAISEFQSIIRTYPHGEYADNAQYWIGVVLLKKGDETGARRAFQKVIQNYPGGNKVQDAETKLRMLQRNQPEY